MKGAAQCAAANFPWSKMVRASQYDMAARSRGENIVLSRQDGR